MIHCCKDCVAPKRYPGCHSTCPDYIREKAIHEEEREKINKDKTKDNDYKGSRENSFIKRTKAKKGSWYSSV